MQSRPLKNPNYAYQLLLAVHTINVKLNYKINTAHFNQFQMTLKLKLNLKS